MNFQPQLFIVLSTKSCQCFLDVSRLSTFISQPGFNHPQAQNNFKMKKEVTTILPWV